MLKWAGLEKLSEENRNAIRGWIEQGMKTTLPLEDLNSMVKARFKINEEAFKNSIPARVRMDEALLKLNPKELKLFRDKIYNPYASTLEEGSPGQKVYKLFKEVCKAKDKEDNPYTEIYDEFLNYMIEFYAIQQGQPKAVEKEPATGHDFFKDWCFLF